MPSKIILPEPSLVERWLAGHGVTARSLAAEFGCTPSTISAVLRRHLAPDRIEAVKREKIAASCSKRPDLRTKANQERLQNGRRCPEKARRTIAKAVAKSVEARRGRPLSAAHREKLSVIHTGKRAGPLSPSWKGGTSRICWRGAGWAVARRTARTRDGDTCRACGKTAEQQGRAMDVHHRTSYFTFASPAEANDLDNLVCLCRSCHRRVENKTIVCP